MSKIVELRERIEFYRKKKASQSTSKNPVTREEFDALIEELEIYIDEIHKTQQLLNRLVRVLHASSMKDETEI